MIKGEIFKYRAIFSELSTSQSADFTNKAKLKIKIKIQNISILINYTEFFK